MAEPKPYEAAAILHDASKRLEQLRQSLPSTTRGLFEFCMMLRLIEGALPKFAEWARSEVFLEHLITWTMAGCPEFVDDETTRMLEEFQKGKWVN